MNIIKLTENHKSAIRPLFEQRKYMGIQAQSEKFIKDNKPFADFFLQAFSQTYLSNLENYHVYGAINDSGIVEACIGFYESYEDASWYWTHVKSINQTQIKLVLDKVIEHNESKGRFKFYSMFPAKYVKTYRRLAFSQYNKERYDYFDEFYVKERHQCLYTLPWQILYNRSLLPVDTVVRCTFLKQKYRQSYDAGRL